jgi:hypothetical protein
MSVKEGEDGSFEKRPDFFPLVPCDVSGDLLESYTLKSSFRCVLHLVMMLALARNT